MVGAWLWVVWGVIELDWEEVHFFDDIWGGEATPRGVTAGAARSCDEISCMLTKTNV